MIDIHSHILPGLDDGAEDIGQSLAMLDVAAAAGTTDIVASPHANFQFRYEPQVVDSRIAELRALRPGGPRIHRGCDFHLIPENIQEAMADPARYSINGKGHLLVEFSDLMIPKTSLNIFRNMLGARLVPVITHPERNMLLQRRFDEMAAWVEAGCLMQVTGLSLLGQFGKQAKTAAEELMRRGMVHFIASDAHDATFRPPALDKVYSHVEERYGERVAQVLLVENPGAALNGEACGPMPPPVSRKRWFGVFGR
jgi:protein-tyrosine phosphatase